MQLRALRDLIVIKEQDLEKFSKGGIALLGDDKETPATAAVLSVGPGLYDKRQKRLVPLNVKVGDEIIFVRNSGDLTKIDGEEFRIISVDSVIGILT